MGVIFGTPGAVYLRYSLAVSPNVYAVFPPSLSVEYTFRPITANLLYTLKIRIYTNYVSSGLLDL